ncbi:hypothetical protein CDAR_408751 [Caerostris darwini]|uniref:Uncharacterized protein n=1 Tax=Caerostris darwini TaxID=1538125 RepID=A0AAV4MDE4_9ARAC|nr:hypothetical protein CDAR_408751 [Caerostris darwini]
MECRYRFNKKRTQIKRPRRAVKLYALNIVYVFVIGDPYTGKTHLIDLLATRRIYDPLLPSFEYVSESDRMTDIGVITLRLLELKGYHLEFPEILQVCQAAKHVFLFVFSHGNLCTFFTLDCDWISRVRAFFGWTVATVVLGNKVDLKNDNHDYCSYKRQFYVDYAFECSALTGDHVEAVFYEIAMFGNETWPLFEPLAWRDYIKRVARLKKLF